MAEFSADPSLAVNVPQPDDLLGMAGKAAQLHQTLMQTTGMGLDQHFQRLSTVFRGGMALLGPDGSADPAAIKSLITDGVAQKNLTASDGAMLLTNVPTDPKLAGRWLQSGLAGVGNALDAITPHIGYQGNGSGSTAVQSNAFAPGGASTPAITNGMSASELAAPKDWTDATGATHQGTMGEYLKSQGVNTSPQIGANGFTQFGPSAKGAPVPGQTPLAPPQPVATTPLAPTGQHVAGQAMAALGTQAPPPGGNALTNPPANLMTGAPGAGGQPIVTSPDAASTRTRNLTNFTADMQAGTNSNIPAVISNLQGIISASDNASVGSMNEWRQNIAKAFDAVGINISGSATDTDILHKETGMLAQQLGASGQNTDAGAVAQMNITPNGDMTPGAIKTTAALVMGLLQYKMNMAKAATAFQSGGKDVANNYAAFQSDYIANSKSPLMLAMPNMPQKQFNDVWAYVKKLPADQKAQFIKQYQSVGP